LLPPFPSLLYQRYLISYNRPKEDCNEEYSQYINYSPLFHFSRYEVIVDVAPEIKWISDDAYKNLKVVVEIDNEIDAHIASEKEFRRRYKSAGVLKVVTDRGLQVIEFNLC
jgi:FKBP-type peptidyl-prolyl cis-trans isomerase (trigger factor)